MSSSPEKPEIISLSAQETRAAINGFLFRWNEKGGTGVAHLATEREVSDARDCLPSIPSWVASIGALAMPDSNSAMIWLEASSESTESALSPAVFQLLFQKPPRWSADSVLIRYRVITMPARSATPGGSQNGSALLFGTERAYGSLIVLTPPVTGGVAPRELLIEIDEA